MLGCLRRFYGSVMITQMNELLSTGLRRPVEEEDCSHIYDDELPANTSKLVAEAWHRRGCMNQTAELPRRSQKRGSRIVLSLWDAFGTVFLLTAALHLIELCLQLVPPFMIKSLVSYVEGKRHNLNEGLRHAAIFSLAQFVQGTIGNWVLLRNRCLGFSAMGAVQTIVFRKALRLSGASQARLGTGKVMNIMQVDTSRFFDFFVQLTNIWAMPFTLLACLLLLLQDLGIAALAPYGICVLAFPVSKRVGHRLVTTQRAFVAAADSRVKLLTEVLQALRLVKMLSWEAEVKALIDERRALELKQIKRMKICQACNSLLFEGIPAVMPLVAFSTYVMLGKPLNVALVFSALSILDLIRLPASQLPQSVAYTLQTKVGLERMEEVLMAQETQHLRTSDSSNPLAYVGDGNSRSAELGAVYRRVPFASSQLPAGQPHIRMEGAQFAWSVVAVSGQEPVASSPLANEQSHHCTAAVEHCRRHCYGLWLRLRRRREVPEAREARLSFLQDACPPVIVDVQEESKRPDSADGNTDNAIGLQANARASPFDLTVPSFRVPLGSFVFVVGRVGAGKSTFLAGLLNEITQETGIVDITGPVAYCPQVPWILYSTLKNNILLGDECNEDRYQRVVEACALVQDLRELPNGSDTMIGERGLNLSGGQKARVALARACYSGSSVFLFDDPLAAVDAHVSDHLVQRCLSSSGGLLQGSTRVLVTHQVQHLRFADLVVVVRDGEVAAVRAPSSFESSELELLGLGHGDGGRQHNGDDSAACSKADVHERGAGEGGTSGSAANGTPCIVEAAPRSLSQPDVARLEDRRTGAVSLQVWFTYARQSGIWLSMVLLLCFAAARGFNLGATLWIAEWSRRAEAGSSGLSSLLVYTLLLLTGICFMLARVLIFIYASLSVSRDLHHRALDRVLHSPMAWLDLTPSGRIVNRFSQDMTRVDMVLSQNVADLLDQACSLIVSFSLVFAAEPHMAWLVIPLGFGYWCVQRKYRTSGRELQRLTTMSRSPIYQSLGEAMTGVSTIRAFEKEQYFDELHVAKVTRFILLWHTTQMCNRWMQIRTRLLGAILNTALAFYFVLSDAGHIGSSLGLRVTGTVVGLTLRYGLQLTGTFEVFMVGFGLAEMSLVAIERLSAYTELSSEEATLMKDEQAETPSANGGASSSTLASQSCHRQPVADTWPQSGSIEFYKVAMRYRRNLPLVLRSVSFKIQGGTSLGIVGRTGSGKSSMMQALFRLYSLESGSIWIDGVNISKVDLHTLRSRLSIIPQDPVGFTGTLRFNLDPLSKETDEAIWAELEKVQLRDYFERMPGKLAYALTVGGENLSVGQRQLICVARALLRRSRLLVLDEATSAVDFNTDALMQQVLKQRTEEVSLTTLTIAHRITTIMSSDNVLVMEAGEAIELGPPEELSADTSSAFSRLVRSAGARTAQ